MTVAVIVCAAVDVSVEALVWEGVAVAVIDIDKVDVRDTAAVLLKLLVRLVGDGVAPNDRVAVGLPYAMRAGISTSPYGEPSPVVGSHPAAAVKPVHCGPHVVPEHMLSPVTTSRNAAGVDAAMA